MSRAFVKEDSGGQPPIIPPRAALPAGTPNYVTPEGLEQLRQELTELEAQRAKVAGNSEDEAERTRQLTILNAQINSLNERLGSAKLIDPRTQPAGEVRFGAQVRLRTRSGGKPGTVRTFTVVGVDEASVADGKVAFVAPIARAVLGKQLGETAVLRFGRAGDEVVEVAAIDYPAAHDEQ